MKKINLLLILISIYFSAFSQAPTITSFSPARGPVGTLVTITGTNLSSPTAFTIGGVSAIAVSNTGTTLVGMVMPGAVTGTVSVTTASGNDTGSRHFIILPTPAPSLQQGLKLAGNGVNNSGIIGPQQGYSVAISADGNTAISGGYLDDSLMGAIWIFERSGNTWNQQGSKLIGTGAVRGPYGVQQGGACALSADGNTAIVGGNQDSNGVGAAWIFTRTAGIWTQQGQKLVGTGYIGSALQGSSVALSADGNTAIVGGYTDNSGEGAVWIYTRSAGIWTQQGPKIVASGSVFGANLGEAVSLSADGNIAIVGGPEDNNDAGASWIFSRIGGVWTQQGSKLVGAGAINGSSGSQQGSSVSISADGNTAIIGAYSDSADRGAAWVFIQSGGVWTQQGNELLGSGFIGNCAQGYVSISADGNTAIMGGPGDNSSKGATWVFTRAGGVWTQQGNKLVGITGTVNPSQGRSVCLSSDGTTAIVGGPLDNYFTGATWIFVSSVCTPITSVISRSICSGNSYSFHNQNLSTSGTYYDTLTSIGGCDSIITLNLTVNALPVVTFNQTDTAWEITSMSTPSLNGGSPSGGHYNGPFVIADSIVNVSFGTGYDSIFAITYSYTDSIGCTASASHLFKAYIVEGISEINDKLAIHVYPDPNKGSFTLQTSGSFNNEYVICDMLGHIVTRDLIRSDKQSIEMPDAAEGVYTLSVAGAVPVRFVVLR